MGSHDAFNQRLGQKFHVVALVQVAKAWRDREGLSPVASEADDMATLRLLARGGAGLAVLPPIVVRDELASGLLVERAQLSGITEQFLAVTLQRRFPNPLASEVMNLAIKDAEARQGQHHSVQSNAD